MRSIDDYIHKYIGPNEKIEKVYHQSESYLKENPLNSVLNLLMITSFIINAVIIFVLKNIGFSKDNPIEIAGIGAIFYGFNLLLYFMSLTNFGAILRRKVFGFRYSYSSKADDDEDEDMYFKNSYTVYIAVALFFCSISVHLSAINPISNPSLIEMLLSVSPSVFFAIIIIFKMIYRYNQRMVCVLTNRRVFLIYENTLRGHYIERKYIYRVHNVRYFYDISVNNEFWLANTGILDYLFRREECSESPTLFIPGMRGFSKLYMRLSSGLQK
jgi:hypothetical protein